MDKNKLIKQWDKILKDEGLAPLYTEISLDSGHKALYPNFNDKDINRIYKNSSHEYVEEHVQYFERAGILAVYYPRCRTPRQSFEKKVFKYHVQGLTSPEILIELKKFKFKKAIFLHPTKRTKKIPTIDSINVIIRRHASFLGKLNFASIPSWGPDTPIPNPVRFLMKRDNLKLFLKERK